MSLFDSVEAEGYLAGGGVALVQIKAGHSNAPLILAAPDLLEALKEMTALYDDILKSNNIGKMCFQNYARLNEAPMLARQAIAKAEGESNG